MNDMSLCFRPVEVRDHAILCELLADPAELFRVYPAGTAPFDSAQLQGLLREREDVTVIEVDGSVAGFAGLYNVCPESAFIGNLVIAPRWRGRGIGLKLLQHMLGLIAARAIPEARLSVFVDNANALRLYHRNGFIPFAMEERIAPDRRVVMLLHMKKLICGDIR